jgi:hypothetical protein
VVVPALSVAVSTMTTTVRPCNVWIAAAVITAATTLRLEVDRLITAGSDGRHRKGSKHATREALDIWTTHLSAVDRSTLLTAIRGRLGEDYDVVLESLGQPHEHAHIERDVTP